MKENNRVRNEYQENSKIKLKQLLCREIKISTKIHNFHKGNQIRSFLGINSSHLFKSVKASLSNASRTPSPAFAETTIEASDFT